MVSLARDGRNTPTLLLYIEGEGEEEELESLLSCRGDTKNAQSLSISSFHVVKNTLLVPVWCRNRGVRLFISRSIEEHISLSTYAGEIGRKFVRAEINILHQPFFDLRAEFTVRRGSTGFDISNPTYSVAFFSTTFFPKLSCPLIIYFWLWL